VDGSFRNKVVAYDLAEERNKCDFDFNEMTVLMNGGPHLYNVQKNWLDLMDKHPAIQPTAEWNEMTPHEQQTEQWKRIKYIDQNLPDIFTKSQVNHYPYFFWMNYL